MRWQSPRGAMAGLHWLTLLGALASGALVLGGMYVVACVGNLMNSIT